MTTASKIRWGTERRLEFIEFRLYWEGGVRRGEISEKFGVSIPQASADLGLYQQLAPDNLTYDASEKRYVSTDTFAPLYLSLEPEIYLSQVRDHVKERPSLTDHWLGTAPSAAVMPLPVRQVDPSVLRQLVTAIRKKQSIEVFYHSMSEVKQEYSWRWLSPHSLVNDGARWHIRAFCHRNQAFRDFLLSRCNSTRGFGESQSDIANDTSWNEIFDVVICPNPKLTDSQRRGVIEDYGMTDGKLVLSVRRALLFYFEKNLRLDTADIDGNPAATPLKIANYQEFKLAIAKN
ncbi:WYL domain-containing protein [Pseudacidovorax sp. NFM-22]|uniref:WYL domain-containing protein n=1 Tax=Pseudacidovorax sp. NFM-22 TaxID=2744469 RepID=UPI001F44A3B3|nr:WYL domain-containing protein [Pseudacidovorax sp. NFM-22]